MPLSFPSNPSVNQTSTQNGRVYVWSGSAWEFSSTSPADDARWGLFAPPAPAAPTVTAGNAQVSLRWSAPTVLAQTPITDYVIQYSSNSGSTWTTFSDGTSTATSATVTGLTNGTAYTFRVAAVNGVGQGPYSSASGSVTPSPIQPLPSLSGSLIGVYSTRLAVSGYSGPLMTIRRDSDNATTDVPADYSGIAAWIGSANAFVTSFKDQSGNGSHLSATGNVTFDLDGDTSTGGQPFAQISSSAYFSGSTSGLNGKTNAILSAVLVPVGSQSAGSNYVNNAVIYFVETGGWGTVSLSCLDAEIAWRFGTGSFGNRGVLRSRSSASNALCVATASRLSGTERCLINGAQVGATYSQGGAIEATSSTLAVGGGEYTPPNAKVCEIVVYADNASGEDVSIANSQAARFGIS